VWAPADTRGAAIARDEEAWIGRALVERAITAVLAPLVVLLIAFFFSGFLQQQFREATCDDPKDLQLLTPSAVHASSQLSSPDHLYDAERAIDTNTGTAWVEGAARYGIGETLTVEFAAAHDLQMVCVVNGYARSPELYTVNGRVRQLAVTTAQGSTTAVLADLPVDEIAAFPSIRVPHGTTTRVTFEIRSTSSGGGTKAEEDTSISEVEFWGR